MEDPKDVVEEETLLPTEERYLSVFAKQICGDNNKEKRREKVVSERVEKEMGDLKHCHDKKPMG